LGDPIAAASMVNSSNRSSLLQPCPIAINAIMNVLQHDPTAAASYVNAMGTIEARTAIAAFHSHEYYTCNPDNDVIIANGCSGALELILSSLLCDDYDGREVSILLVPEPGVPLYRVIAESHGARVISYPLCPDQHWEIDFQQLHDVVLEIQQANRNDPMSKQRMVIRGMVVNNPSNPTGAVYSEHHLSSIVKFCNLYHIPIIADEIYGDLTFEPLAFIPIAQIAGGMGRTVPIVTASGIGKQYLLPGWRIGWICFQDKLRI
jgi:tyrosine aminotransferase